MTRLLAWPLLAAVALVAPVRTASAQETHVLIITGVGGDEEHAAQFHKWAVAVADAAKAGGVPETNITYLGDQPDKDPARIKARSTRDNVTRAFGDIAAKVKPNDTVFILLLGHGSFDGRVAAFNLAGPDLTAEDYAKLLDKFGTAHIVFANTASSSGAFLQALAGPGRVIVTATKTGGERNETRFPQYFVEALQGDAADRDRNGRVSVLEAFDYAKTKVVADYEKGGHILTEHATLDDGSEGKFAATLSLAPQSSKMAALAKTADPELRKLLEERDALDRQIAELRVQKDRMPAADYEAQLEKLVTQLALKDRAIREREAQK